MQDEPLDLSPLDPRADPVRWEGLVGAIVRAAGAELARRRSDPRGVLDVVARWWRPTLAAAATVAAVATLGLALTADPAGEPAPAAGLVEAFRLPEPVSAWLAEDRGPTAADVVVALQEEPVR